MEPNRFDLDREVEDKLAALLARQWTAKSDQEVANYLRLAEVYLASRQVSMLSNIANQIAHIKNMLSDMREIMIVGFTTGFAEDDFEEEEDKTNGPKQ